MLDFSHSAPGFLPKTRSTSKSPDPPATSSATIGTSSKHGIFFLSLWCYTPQKKRTWHLKIKPSQQETIVFQPSILQSLMAGRDLLHVCFLFHGLWFFEKKNNLDPKLSRNKFLHPRKLTSKGSENPWVEDEFPFGICALSRGHVILGG